MLCNESVLYSFFYGWIVFHCMDILHFRFPGGSDGKDSAMQRDMDLIPGLGRSPWRRGCLPTPVFLPGESHGQRGAWKATVHGVEKNRTQLSDFTFSTFCLSVYQLMDIGVVSTLGLFWIILLLAFVCKLFFLYELLFSCLLGIFLGVELLVIWQLHV